MRNAVAEAPALSAGSPDLPVSAINVADHGFAVGRGFIVVGAAANLGSG